MHKILILLCQYSDSYSAATGSLWNYYRDQVIDDANENDDVGNYRINSNKTTASKSFGYKTKIIGSTPADKNRSVTERRMCCSIKLFQQFLETS